MCNLNIGNIPLSDLLVVKYKVSSLLQFPTKLYPFHNLEERDEDFSVIPAEIGATNIP